MKNKTLGSDYESGQISEPTAPGSPSAVWGNSRICVHKVKIDTSAATYNFT